MDSQRGSWKPENVGTKYVPTLHYYMAASTLHRFELREGIPHQGDALRHVVR